MEIRSRRDDYIECPRLKNRPRKHVRVCEKCRYSSKCQAYQDYLQLELPFGKAFR